MSIETIAGVLAKVAERVVLGPAANQRAERETKAASQVAQCQRCDKSGYPIDAISLARAS